MTHLEREAREVDEAEIHGGVHKAGAQFAQLPRLHRFVGFWWQVLCADWLQVD